MDAHSLYFVAYALAATLGGTIVAQAQYTRKQREGTPINFKLMKVIFGFALVMWTGAALATVYYTSSQAALTISGIFIGIMLSLFFGWKINAIIRKIETDEKTIEELATHDALTGLWIRRVFHQTLKKEIKLAHEQHQPLSLLVLEVDNLPEINHEHGYELGDFVLRKLARIITKAVRPTDLVCRFRSQEIAIIFPNLNGLTTEKFSRSFQAEIAGNAFNAEDGTKVFATVTIGIAAYTEQTPTDAALIAAAEGGLAEAKESGHNSLYMV